MSYDFTKSNGTTPVSVADNAINTTLFSIGLVGKNVSGYGLTIAENFVWMLENFANGSAPVQPTVGQLWYNTTTTSLMVYDGSNWKKILSQDPTTNNYIFDGDLLPAINCGGSTGFNIGSNTLQWCNVYANTFVGVATQARYADVAERYEADSLYDVGTVVSLGGDKEITATGVEFDNTIFGVISKNPAFLMNCDVGTNDTHPPIAITGRVETKVTGQIKKGQRLVSSNIPGVAQAINDSDLNSISTLSIIGRALEDKNTDEIGLVLTSIGAK
jgi:hypothetical protein